MMMLIDKGFYDYDYKYYEKHEDEVPWEDTVKSDEEVHDMLSQFGFKFGAKRVLTAEDIQNHIRETEKWQ